MAKRQAHIEEAEINITPMLDIVFIMLIFFIVTASFIREPGVTVEKPLAAQAAALRNGTILIAVQPGGGIWMEGRRIEMNEIPQTVERARAENPEGSVVIVADKGARIGTVTQVMDHVRQAGVDRVSVSAVSRAD